MDKQIAQHLLIRPMRLEDIGDVHAIDVSSFPLPWPERSFRFEITDNPNAVLWVAEIEHDASRKKVVGFIAVWVIIDEMHIGSIAVHPEYREMGIGKKLLAASLNEASKRGVRQVFLEVRASNLAAQALYQRFGFEVDGIRPRYYQDNHEDAILMTLRSLDGIA